jgi:hypothetical protein
LGNKKSSFLFCLERTKSQSVQNNIEIRVVDALFCFELSKNKTFFLHLHGFEQTLIWPKMPEKKLNSVVLNKTFFVWLKG